MRLKKIAPPKKYAKKKSPLPASTTIGRKIFALLLVLTTPPPTPLPAINNEYAP